MNDLRPKHARAALTVLAPILKWGSWLLVILVTIAGIGFGIVREGMIWGCW